eukprot:6651135-Karenia_brevis.AAC.1
MCIRDRSDLTSEAWAAQAVSEVNAANRGCANHVCRPAVCHSTRRGQDGTCRLGFWEYKAIAKDGKLKIVKIHGRSLEKRWLGQAASESSVFPAAGHPDELPPIHLLPPQE